MARRFGRSWSAALTIALLFIAFATYYTLQPLRDAPSIVVEPESRVVLEKPSPVATRPLDTDEGSLHDEEQPGKIDKEPESVEKVPEPPEYTPPETPQPEDLDAVDPTPAQPEQPSQESPTPESPTPETSEPEAPEPEEPSPEKSKPVEETEGPVELSTGEPQRTESDWHTSQDDDEDEEVEEEPEPPPPSKIIVIGKLSDEDTEWVQQELADWQSAIYVVDLGPNETSPTGLRTRMNKAREAMPYLTYIIENYPNFPDVVAFIHPHRKGLPKAWHNDARGNDAVNMMRDLKIDTILDRGYVNLRCNNEVGCPDEVQPFRDPPDPLKYAEHAFPYVYGNFFNTTFTQMRESIRVVATQCCAQFAVSKDQLLKLPKHEYERYRTFLEETHYDDATVGRVMEYMWHIIFGRDAVHCENMFECWCAVYGRCFGRMGGGGGGFRGRPPW